MRLRHYSIRTERCDCDWIRRYVQLHGMKSRVDLEGGEAKIELFLGDLALQGQVAASTQNQAFNALLFLYHDGLYACLARRRQRLEESAGLLVNQSFHPARAFKLRFLCSYPSSRLPAFAVQITPASDAHVTPRHQA